MIPSEITPTIPTQSHRQDAEILPVDAEQLRSTVE